MSNIPLKKNKYQEYLDTLISENTYSVAEQINTSIEIAGKVLKVIVVDLGFTEVNVNSIVRTAELYGDDNKDTALVKCFVAPMNRQRIDLELVGNIYGYRNGNAWVSVDPKSTVKIRVVIRELKGDVFINGLDPMYDFYSNRNLQCKDSFLVPLTLRMDNKAFKLNIKNIREMLDKVIKFYKLTDNFTFTIDDYNLLLSEINKLKTEVANLKEELAHGAIKVKRDKKINDAIQNSIDEANILGIHDIDKAYGEILATMTTLGWVKIELKDAVIENVRQLRISFTDWKVHPVLLKITITSNKIDFFIAKYATPVDETTGGQYINYDLVHSSVTLADAMQYIKTELLP